MFCLCHSGPRDLALDRELEKLYTVVTDNRIGLFNPSGTRRFRLQRMARYLPGRVYGYRRRLSGLGQNLPGVVSEL
jgi:hypothetical protein